MRRNPRAIDNLPKTPDGYEFDTVADMIEFEKARGNWGPPAPRQALAHAPAPQRAAAPPQRASIPVTAPPAARHVAPPEPDYADEEEPPPPRFTGARRPTVSADSLNVGVATLAKYIGMALGGLETYCPGSRAGVVKGDKSTNVDHLSTLISLGFPRERFRDVALLLREEGLISETIVTWKEKQVIQDGQIVTRPAGTNITYRCKGIDPNHWNKNSPQTNPELIAQAHVVLESLGIKLQCPSKPAKPNPYSRRSTWN